MTTAVENRTVHVEHCMGTVFSLEIRSDDDPAEAITSAIAELHRIDRVFSTYRHDSEVSRLARRELRLADADPDVAEVFYHCAEVRSTTDGWFNPMVDGRIDPTGLVKGWAVERISTMLTQAGFVRHAVNGGGDVRVAGGTAPGQPWRIGIADPRDRSRTVATVALFDGAVATSGTAERGAHIRDPFTGRATTQPQLSTTVIGPSMTYADAYATACFAMGADAAYEWIQLVDGHDLLTVDESGTVRAGRSAARLIA